MMPTDFHWFFGVVEDRNDPLHMGRVRVRVFGYHTQDKTLLPVENLPWAQSMLPSNGAASGNIGQSPTGAVEGTWVIGFFCDGDKAERPIVIGTIGGFPTAFADSSIGFNDPNSVYPTRIKESDVNQLAKKEADSEHPVDEFRDRLADDLIGEPIPDRDSQYPFNHVKETESGHIEEYDDTPGNERIMRMHRSGTMEEYHPDGVKVERVVKDKYEVVFGSSSLRVRGNCNIVVDGNSDIYVRGNSTVQTDGSVTEYVGGDYKLYVDGDIEVKTNKSYTRHSIGDSNVRADTYYVDTSGTVKFATGLDFLVYYGRNFDTFNIDVHQDPTAATTKSARDSTPAPDITYTAPQGSWPYRKEVPPASSEPRRTPAEIEKPANRPVKEKTTTVTASPAHPKVTADFSTGSVCGLNADNARKMLVAIGTRESGNNYAAENTIGFIGKYQFGAAALVDAGYINRDKYMAWRRAGRPGRQKSFLADESNWNIEGGKQGWFNNPGYQEDAMQKMLASNCSFLKRRNVITDSSSQKEIAGYLLAGQLGGASSVVKMARDASYEFKDAYGSSIRYYYNLGFNAVD